jgi:hypothetical protein
LKLASNFLNLIASLASAFFLLSVSLFSPASAHCTNAQQRHDFGEFFSDLASKNFELFTSLASALKILIPPLVHNWLDFFDNHAVHFITIVSLLQVI